MARQFRKQFLINRTIPLLREWGGWGVWIECAWGKRDGRVAMDTECLYVMLCLCGLARGQKVIKLKHLGGKFNLDLIVMLIKVRRRLLDYVHVFSFIASLYIALRAITRVKRAVHMCISLRQFPEERTCFA